MAQIPQFLSHLKTFGDYPVPFVQMGYDGKPDFRVLDPDKVSECVEQKLCAICGVTLGEFCWFIGNDKAKMERLFHDPPMHEQCADFVAITCPFVSGKRNEYSQRPLNEDTFTSPGQIRQCTTACNVHSTDPDEENWLRERQW